MARPAVTASVLVFALGMSALRTRPAQAAPPAPLPALPSANSSPTPAAPSSGSTEASGFTAEQVRRGIVQVEQGGRALAIGTVLLKDGRVLTALSALTNVDQPEIRYADGTVVKTKIGHKDKAWDLALLIPLNGKWLDGLVPTDADPQGVDLRSFASAPKTGKLSPAPIATAIAVKGRVDAQSKEGDALRSVLELDLKGSPATAGSPLVDGNGRVVGIVVKACKEGGTSTPPNVPPCSAVTVGAPVYALRGFLVKTPANAVQPAPWLGLGGAPSASGNVKGVRVMGVAPSSPAEKAGLKAGGDAADTIVAVDGAPVETPEMLAEVIAKCAIGQQVKLLVFSGGKFREAPVTLRSAP